jgi:hypothetical protein
MIETTNNDEENGSDNINWKVVSNEKMTTLLHKAKQHEHGETSTSSVGGSKHKNGSGKDDGGLKAKLTSSTVEVRFMTDPAKRSSFKLCMMLR